MKWFTEVFLQSLKERMNNPKYPNQCILSQKQADVCYKYMKSKQCCDDYGRWFCTYELTYNGECYLMSFRGKYTFLNVYPVG